MEVTAHIRLCTRNDLWSAIVEVSSIELYRTSRTDRTGALMEAMDYALRHLRARKVVFDSVDAKAA